MVIMQFNARKAHLFLSFALLCCFSLVGCATGNYMPALHAVPQNTLVYLNPITQNQPLISAQMQQRQMQNYLQHYFSPWEARDEGEYTNDDIKDMEQDRLEQFSLYPGWGANEQPHAQGWMQAITHNVDIATFPNHLAKAITLQATNVRLLPTNDPSFNDWHAAGQGYPFDNLQESFIPANTPILILQTSRDGAWDLVLMDHLVGWIVADDVAYVDYNFMQRWHNKHYFAFIHDHVPVFDTDHHYRFDGRIGAIYPLAEMNNSTVKIFIAVADSAQQAVIKTATINRQDIAAMPMLAVQANIATIANSLLGVPYGWGGYLGYRDCSSTMQDLFTPFGLWLPRNSAEQMRTGRFTGLATLSSNAKARVITRQGVPFFTLIGIHGHIMLYIGQRDGQPYVLQDVWGVHTKNVLTRTRGRSVIGQTVITPLSLGAGYINTDKFLDEVFGMTVLPPIL